MTYDSGLVNANSNLTILYQLIEMFEQCWEGSETLDNHLSNCFGIELKNYTRNINDAMSFIPEGWKWRIGSRNPYVIMDRFSEYPYPSPFIVAEFHRGKENLPLGICLCSLKALVVDYGGIIKY